MSKALYSRVLTPEEFEFADEMIPHWEERRIFYQPLLFLVTLLQHPDGVTMIELRRKLAREPYMQMSRHSLNALKYRVTQQVADMYTIRTTGKRGRPNQKYHIEPVMIGESKEKWDA